VQFSCVAGDEAGEIVCAGALEPFNVYVWSLQTGRLLDVLAGHSGPVSSLAFSGAAGLLASGSWDKTVRLWDIFRSGGTAAETLLHPADVTAVAFRPDGHELCAATLDGNISVWDVRRGVQVLSVDVRKDLAGGRRADEARRAESRNATSLCYSADGSAMLVGGNSKFVCLYALPSKMLVRRFQVSHNRSLDGVLDKLNSALVGEDGVPLGEGDFDEDDELGRDGGPLDEGRAAARERDKAALPGAKRSNAASRRNVRLAVWSRSVTFSPAGDMFAAATPDGVSVYRQDEAAVFDPFELGEDVTMDALDAALAVGRYSRAALIALHLGEASAVAKMLSATPLAAVRSVARAVPRVFVHRLLAALAVRLDASPHLEHAMAWVIAALEEHGEALRRETGAGSQAAAPLQQLQKALLRHRESVAKLAESNRFALGYIVLAD
jgi:periodic tryptophan protein 2